MLFNLKINPLEYIVFKYENGNLEQQPSHEITVTQRFHVDLENLFTNNEFDVFIMDESDLIQY